jgi:RimJ/RimL family protein N-acetyltransferase
VTSVLDRGWFPWTVRLLRDVGGRHAGTIVGWSSYLEISPNDARLEIGNTAYDPAVWGSVVNPECKLLLLGYAFDELQMGRVQLKTDIRNHRSQAAIARLGAHYEGVLRRYQRRADGTVRDTVMFSITAEDWPEVRRSLEDRVAASA